jgi:hypothetical protein
MRIMESTRASNGNVGIGTTTPSEKLEVNGKLKVNDAEITNNLRIQGTLTASSFNVDPSVIQPSNNKFTLSIGIKNVWNRAGNITMRGTTVSGVDFQSNVEVGDFLYVEDRSLPTQVKRVVSINSTNRSLEVAPAFLSNETAGPAFGSKSYYFRSPICLDVTGGIRIRDPQNPDGSWVDIFFAPWLSVPSICFTHRNGRGFLVNNQGTTSPY